MKVVILVDGREAVPVRAIPFVTGWNLSPDALAHDLEKQGRRSGHQLRAFQYDADDSHPSIMPGEWEQVSVALKALDLTLVRVGGVRSIVSYERWRAESPECLPSGCFIWRDEFEAACLDGTLGVTSDNEEPPELNFSPLIPPDLRELVMEGFPPAATVKADASDHGSWPWGAHETKLLRELAEAAQRFWVRYDPTDMTTAPTNEDVIAWLEDRGVSNNLAKAIASILRADGLPPGPRK